MLRRRGYELRVDANGDGADHGVSPGAQDGYETGARAWESCAMIVGDVGQITERAKCDAIRVVERRDAADLALPMRAV